jgi:hypothetical protein
VKKPESRIDVSIESGAFFLKARQAILSARKNQPIETSFYLNEGAFYEKIKNITLNDVFKDRSIQFNNIDTAIDFVFSLLSQHDERFACFPVSSSKRLLNEVDNVNMNRFKHSIDRTLKIDDKDVFIPRGMFITPFIKVRHVLEEISSFLGYSLAPSFLDVAPFKDMVFLNNNADTIMLSSIEYVDLVPAATIEAFLNVLRKFNCEFIPNDSTKELKVIIFNDIFSEEKIDLSAQLVGFPAILYHNDYKRVTLTSEIFNAPAPEQETEGFESNANNNFNTLSELAKTYPSGRVDNTDGSIYRIGFRGEKETVQRLGSLHCNYSDDGSLSEYGKSFPDKIVEVFKSMFLRQASEGGQIIGWYYILYPYIGSHRNIRTQLIYDDEESENNAVRSDKTEDLPAMLCLYFLDSELGFNTGTINNYNLSGERLWNYSLAYNGDDGIFERFWRKYDDLLRNALLEVRGDFLLMESQKMMIPSYRPVVIDGQVLLPSEIKYIPGRDVTLECVFLSTKLQEPVSIARMPDAFFKNHQYEWKLKSQRNFTNNVPSGYVERIIYKSPPEAYFPDNPTPDQFSAGGKYFERQFNVEYGYQSLFDFTKIGEGIITTWLEPVLV